MDPNQQPQQTPYSIDYLNQIASDNKKPALDNKLFFMLIGGGLLLTIIVGLFLIFGSGGGPKQQMQTLAARLATLQTIADDSQKNIKSSALRTTNSNLSIFLTNTNRDIVEPLKNNDVKIAELDKSIVAKESGEKLTQALEDARLNVVFDRTYAREMSYQLNTVAVLIKDIYKSTGSKSLKTFLETTDANLQPLIKQFSDFNASTG